MEQTYTATGLAVTGPGDPGGPGVLVVLVAEPPGVVDVPPGARVELGGEAQHPPYAGLLAWFGRERPCRVDVTRDAAGVAGVRFLAGA